MSGGTTCRRCGRANGRQTLSPALTWCTRNSIFLLCWLPCETWLRPTPVYTSHSACEVPTPSRFPSPTPICAHAIEGLAARLDMPFLSCEQTWRRLDREPQMAELAPALQCCPHSYVRLHLVRCQGARRRCSKTCWQRQISSLSGCPRSCCTKSTVTANTACFTPPSMGDGPGQPVFAV